MPPNLNVRGYSHLLGESALSVCASADLADRLGSDFPQLIDGAPFLLPGEDVAIRARLDQWFSTQKLHPRIVGEFDDGALLKAFGKAGAGLFVTPSAVAAQVCEQYDVVVVGKIDGITEQIYAITAERRLSHPAIVAISEGARSVVFGGPSAKPETARRVAGSAAKNASTKKPRPKKPAA